MARLIVPTAGVGFVLLMGYAIYLQAQIWHLF
jgi:hypothetical protein